MAKKPTEETPTYGTDETPEGFIPMTLPDTETPEVETPEVPEIETPETPEVETPKTPEIEAPEVKEEPEEKPTFQFVDGKPLDDKPFMVIKHQGKEVPIATEEEARNFMQKGFDYDYKVGRHGKLAQTLDQHPAFAQKVAQDWEDYLKERTAPRVEEPKRPTLKKLDEFEDPNDWLTENYKSLKAIEESPRKPVEPQQDYSWVSAMVTHDPQNFQKVAPLLPEFAERFLTKAQYDEVNNSLPALVRFYDQVRDYVIKENPKPKPEVTPLKPSFRMKSGGGEAPSADTKPPWEGKNNEEFEQYMAQVKGIASY